MSISSVGRFNFAADDEDDDEALQAVLLASLCAASEVEEKSEAAEKQRALLNACEAPPLVGKPSSLSKYAEELGVDSVKTALQARTGVVCSACALCAVGTRVVCACGIVWLLRLCFCAHAWSVSALSLCT